jgi:hypothetical protein
MSIVEWNAAVAGASSVRGGGAPLPRGDFEQLMKAYPDD